jgi:hypothetical protein
VVENLLYTVRPVIKKVVIKEIIKMIGLCAVFFAGVIVFLSSLKIPSSAIIYLLTSLMLVVMAGLQVFITYGKTKPIIYKYYADRIEVVGAPKLQTFYFSQIEDATITQNIFDKITNTASLKLSKKGSLENISNSPEIATYTQRLIDASKRTTNYPQQNA